MTPPLRFKIVETKEEFEALKVFAASFDHVIDDHSRLPIVNVLRGDRQIGYYQLVNIPMVAPSFHTDTAICSRRDTFDFIQQVRSHRCLMSMGGRTPHGECVAILPEIESPTFTNEILEKLGFVDLHQKLWHALG